jgi:hypothetical protein
MAIQSVREYGSGQQNIFPPAGPTYTEQLHVITKQNKTDNQKFCLPSMSAREPHPQSKEDKIHKPVK